MTESEWLASTDPAAMLRFLTDVAAQGGSGVPHAGRLAADRKLRLFAVACCRQRWSELTDERSRRAVEVAERYADGEADFGSLYVAEQDAQAARNGDIYNNPAGVARYCCIEDIAYAMRIILRSGLLDMPPPATQAMLLRDISGNPWRAAPLAWEGGKLCALSGYGQHGFHLAPTPYYDPVSWLAWNDGTVRRLAESIYEERAFGGPCLVCKNGWQVALTWMRPHSIQRCSVCRGTLQTPNRLPILADALEEAGCADADILNHCRGMQRCPECLGDYAATPGVIEQDCSQCDHGWVPAGPVCGRCSGMGILAGHSKPHPMVPFGPGIKYVFEPPDKYPCPDCGGKGRLPWFSARGDWVVDLLLSKG